MGVWKKKNIEYTEQYIQKILEKYFMTSSKKYEIENLFVYLWESDYLLFTKSGYAYECEIKISRGDFKNDKKKSEKHLILEEDNSDKNRPNYFMYVVPDGLITEDEVPEYAGLMYIIDYFPYCKIVKQPKKLHNEKYDVNKLNLVDKFYYNMWNYKRKSDESNVSDLNSQVRSLEKACTEYDDMLSERTNEVDDLKREINKLKDIIEKYEKGNKGIINS